MCRAVAKPCGDAGLGKRLPDPLDRMARALDALDGLEELLLLGHSSGLHDVSANGLGSLLRIALDELRAAEAELQTARD